MRTLADITENALVEVYEEAHREFGPDDSTWWPGQWREYWLRLDAARIEAGWTEAS